jgi:hypothetical protein
MNLMDMKQSQEINWGSFKKKAFGQENADLRARAKSMLGTYNPVTKSRLIISAESSPDQEKMVA